MARLYRAGRGQAQPSGAGTPYVSFLFVTKKRPFASEGHLHLPREVGPKRAPQGAPPPSAEATRPGAATGGARLRVLGSEPFAEDGGAITAGVLDEGLAHYGLHAGDRVVLMRGRAPEFGDLAALSVALPVEGDDAALVLWKAYPEAEVLRLTSDRATRALPPDTKVAGVVVAVTRALPGPPPTRAS